MTTKQKIVSNTSQEPRIITVRGVKVILDSELAKIYEVPTKRLNEQVKRNRDRFPEDFMFQLTGGTQKSGVLKVAICDLKERPAFKISSLCLHRARSYHGGYGTQQSKGHRDECFCGPCID